MLLIADRPQARRGSLEREPGHAIEARSAYTPVMEKTAKRAWDLILRALARREMSESEVRRKLASKGYPRQVQEEIVEKARRLQLVDDRKVAYNHARFRAESCRRGPQRVRQELLSRGISPEWIEEAIRAAFPPEESGEAVSRALDRMLRGKGMPEDRSGREKVIRRLLRAGFAYPDVQRVVDLEVDDDAF